MDPQALAFFSSVGNNDMQVAIVFSTMSDLSSPMTSYRSYILYSLSIVGSAKIAFKISCLCDSHSSKSSFSSSSRYIKPHFSHWIAY
jgi:hypothetical protein